MTPDQLTDQKIAATLGKAVDLIIEYAEATMTVVYAEGEIRAQMWRNIAAIAAASGGDAMTQEFLDVLRDATAIQVAVYELAAEDVNDDVASAALATCVAKLNADVRKLLRSCR